MIVRAIDSENDWTFGKGRNNYKRDLMALQQIVKTRLQQWIGDCFFAKDDGVDYNNYLDIGTKTFLDRDVRKVILQTEGVLTLNSFESDLSIDRNYTANAKINTIYGVTEVTI